MTFRKVELVAVECDTCGARGPAHSRDHYAEQLAADAATNANPILPMGRAGRHVCICCRRDIAKDVAS